MVPPRIPAGWYPAVALPRPAGAWGIAFERDPGPAGGWLNGGPAADSQCGLLRQRLGADPHFRCHALRARGVQVAEFPGISGSRAGFFWVKCGTGFTMAVDAAQSKPGALSDVKALIDSLVPAGVGPSAVGC
jgi:hypothetical protein